MKNKRFSLYTDGAARGNPGPAGIGIIIRDGRKKVKEVYRYIGETTNNIAEYSALLQGLEEAVKMAADEIVVNLDSELVERQLNGEYKVKDPEIKKLFEKVVSTLKNFKYFEIRHIAREKNQDADKLANKAINLSSLF